MAELGRRLQLAVPPDIEESEYLGGSKPMEQAPRAEHRLQRAAPIRPAAAVETVSPAVAQTVDDPDTAPVSPDDRGGEPDAGTVNELPPVEEMAQRLPAEVRTALDELFRAKWTGVRRLRPEDLRR
jgi:hypothetical protein